VAHPSPPGPRGACYVVASRALSIEAVLKPEVAAALAYLRKRTGSTRRFIEGLLLAERATGAGREAPL
jgi:hypothetical protein